MGLGRAARRTTSAPWWPSSPAASAWASSPSTSTRPGSSWGTPGRCSWASSWRPPPWSSAAGSHRVPTSGVTYFFFAPLFIPFFILGVPIVDMAFAFIRRTARGTSFHTPDKEHIHHRLLRLGHGPRRSVAHPVGLDGHPVRVPPVPPVHAPGQRLHPPGGGRPRASGLYTLFHPGLRKGERRRRRPATRVAGEPSPESRRRRPARRGRAVPRTRRGIVWTPSGPGCDDDRLCTPSTSPRPTPRSAARRPMDSGAPRTA